MLKKITDKLKKIIDKHGKAFVAPVGAVVLDLINAGSEAIGVEFTPEMTVKEYVLALVTGVAVWLKRMPGYNK